MNAQLPALGYSAVRLKWCASALRQLLRRWGVHVAVVLVALGSGASAGLNGMAGLLGLTVLPLVHALSLSAWTALMLTALHSLAGAVLIYAARPILWSRAWARAESALPIAAAELRRSDLVVVGVALLPLVTVYAAGTVYYLVFMPSLAGGRTALQLAGEVALSAGLSFVWGVAILRSMRAVAAGGGAVQRSRAAGAAVAVSSGLVSAALLLPMARGPARGVMTLMLLSCVLQSIPGILMIGWPSLASWWLILYAALGLVFTGRLSAVSEAELAPLHDACAPLPVTRRRLTWLRRIPSGVPLATGAFVMTGAVTWVGVPAKGPWVLVSFMLCHLAFNALQASLAVRRAQIRTSTWSAWWLFALVLLTVLASEAFS